MKGKNRKLLCCFLTDHDGIRIWKLLLVHWGEHQPERLVQAFWFRIQTSIANPYHSMILHKLLAMNQSLMIANTASHHGRLQIKMSLPYCDRKNFWIHRKMTWNTYNCDLWLITYDLWLVASISSTFFRFLSFSFFRSRHKWCTIAFRASQNFLFNTWSVFVF